MLKEIFTKVLVSQNVAKVMLVYGTILVIWESLQSKLHEVDKHSGRKQEVLREFNNVNYIGNLHKS